jgi:thioredoxin 1
MDSLVTARDIIQSGNRVRLFKFSATWCKPCVQIAPVVHELCKNLHPDIQFISVDIDQDSDAYLLLKSKRIVAGIPAIVLYQNGNTNILSPDYVSCGSDINGIKAVFNRAEQFNTFL